MQLGTGERLAEVVVHPGGEAALAVAGDRVGRQRNDRYARQTFAPCLADRRRRFKAVHLGHLAIHQDQVEAAFERHSRANATVDGDLDPAA